MVTIFTPVFNRAYIIPQLYHSLCRQTSMDFEWLVVNDGSTDDIDDVISSFIEEGKINIRYFKQVNRGKHIAINHGVNEAKGELFFIVDSDDYLTEDAIGWITETSVAVMDDERFAGLSGVRIYPDGSKIGGGGNFGVIDANAIDVRLKHGVVGDLAEIFKTSILKQYQFPEFKGEKFCPEALVWFRIARKSKLRYCYKGIYVCKYLPDGLTAKITKLRRESPQASMTFYAEHFYDKMPLPWRMKAAINFWRFSIAPYNKYKMITPLALTAWLPGRFMRILDRNK